MSIDIEPIVTAAAVLRVIRTLPDTDAQARRGYTWIQIAAYFPSKRSPAVLNILHKLRDEGEVTQTHNEGFAKRYVDSQALRQA